MQLPAALEQTTLGDVLGVLHRGRSFGVLELEEFATGRRHEIHFWDGQVVNVVVGVAGVPPLGEVLCRRVNNRFLPAAIHRATFTWGQRCSCMGASVAVRKRRVALIERRLAPRKNDPARGTARNTTRVTALRCKTTAPRVTTRCSVCPKARLSTTSNARSACGRASGTRTAAFTWGSKPCAEPKRGFGACVRATNACVDSRPRAWLRERRSFGPGAGVAVA
jgi:hypothetical protein